MDDVVLGSGPPSESSRPDEHLAVALDNLALTKGQAPGQGLVEKPEARYSGEESLRSHGHPPCARLIGALVPGADQAPAVVDVAFGQVRAQVPAAARDCIATAVDVEHRPASDAAHGSRAELVDRSYELLTLLLRHRLRSIASPGGPRGASPGVDPLLFGPSRPATPLDGPARASSAEKRVDPRSRIATRSGTINPA